MSETQRVRLKSRDLEGCLGGVPRKGVRRRWGWGSPQRVGNVGCYSSVVASSISRVTGTESLSSE